jgi:ssDNA-binding Zn-finger/Zn-ribbon topoisomerase 1
MKTCPSCGGQMVKEQGQIHEPLMNPLRGQGHLIVKWSVRLASFWACSACEHCEEWTR